MENKLREIEKEGHKCLVWDKEEFKIIFSEVSNRGNYKKSEEEGLRNINDLKKQFHMKELIFLNQIHSTMIHYNPSKVIDGDGIIIDKFDVGIGAFGADCTPVIIFDLKKKVIGVVHSGWKGTLNEISKKLAQKMINEFGCEVRNMNAIIGPHARSCCYEVSEEMIQDFNKKKIYEGKVSVGRMLDMSTCIRISLQDIGFDTDKIYDIKKCTICNPQFHSYRRDGEESGRNIAVVMMKESIS